jgi:hypothetical protein
MIIGFDNSGFRRPAQIVGVDVSGFLTIFMENGGASRIVGWDNGGLRIIDLISQGGD